MYKTVLTVPLLLCLLDTQREIVLLNPAGHLSLLVSLLHERVWRAETSAATYMAAHGRVCCRNIENRTRQCGHVHTGVAEPYKRLDGNNASETRQSCELLATTITTQFFQPQARVQANRK